MNIFEQQPYFTSEVSSNHYQDLDRCFEFIDKSKEIGCSAVKFQLFKVEELFSSEVFISNPDVAERKKWELPIDFLPELSKRCKETGIHFSVTPFYLKAVEELEPYVDFFKIASYELLWDDLLIECAKTGLPVVVSTGMAELHEIDHAFGILQSANCSQILFLHCTSAYPTPADESNLAAIETLHKRYHCPIGWSDHTVNPGVIFRAIHKWDAKFIEFHLDLDGKGAEYQTGHCWLPHEIQTVIEASKIGFNSDGTGEKVPVPSELNDRLWRADPSDGLRPLKNIREKIINESKN